MKKTIFLLSLFTIIYYYGCGVDANEKVYRRQITVETDLPILQIGSTILDSTSVYPYILRETIDTNLIPDLIMLNPINKVGFIKFVILGGEGENKPSLSFKNSLTIYTPIDTTRIIIRGFQFERN